MASFTKSVPLDCRRILSHACKCNILFTRHSTDIYHMSLLSDHFESCPDQSLIMPVEKWGLTSRYTDMGHVFMSNSTESHTKFSMPLRLARARLCLRSS